MIEKNIKSTDLFKDIYLEIVPVFAKKGIEQQERLVSLGHDPAACKIGDDDIPTAYAKIAEEYAIAFSMIILD